MHVSCCHSGLVVMMPESCPAGTDHLCEVNHHKLMVHSRPDAAIVVNWIDMTLDSSLGVPAFSYGDTIFRRITRVKEIFHLF